MSSLKVFADGKTLFHVEANVIFDITRNASIRYISVTSNKITAIHISVTSNKITAIYISVTSNKITAIYYNLKIINESLKIVLINMFQNLNRHVTINWQL